MMRQDFWYDSQGKGQLHGCRWIPEGEPRAIVQLVHGIAEFVERYDHFANYLTSLGFVVVAEDHMGHGQSIDGGSTPGYFHGGWFTAVADTVQLAKDTMDAYPGIPYVLFGHSMGSFMARTILCKYPDLPMAAAIICGTGWQPTAAMPALIKVMETICNRIGEETPSDKLQGLIFGSSNKKVEHPRTPFDWLTRDNRVVDAYIAHPRCGFTVACGLMRDMMQGILYIQKPEHLRNMRKDLPVLIIAGGDDPVGTYGKGIRQTEAAFRKAGMTDVKVRIYPLCRHEILNEINKEEIFEDVGQWLQEKLQ